MSPKGVISPDRQAHDPAAPAAAAAPKTPFGNSAAPHAKERIEALVVELEKSGTKIIVPTPVLSEVLVRAGATASQQIVEYINGAAVFRIASFDARAAIELAAMRTVTSTVACFRGHMELGP
jgi:hypothetical protein